VQTVWSKTLRDLYSFGRQRPYGRFANIKTPHFVSIGVLVMVSIVALVLAYNALNPGLPIYTCREGRFTVNIPGEVKAEKLGTPVTVIVMPYRSEIEWHNEGMIGSSYQGQTFAVVYGLQHGTEMFHMAENENVETWMEKWIQEEVEAAKGNSLRLQKITIQDYLAREFEFQRPEGSFVSGRMCVANRRVYRLSITGPKAQLTSPETKQFLRSFNVWSEDHPM